MKKNRHPYLVYFENSKAYQEPLKAYISIPLSLRSWNNKLCTYFERYSRPGSKRPSFLARLANLLHRVNTQQTVPNSCKNHFPVSHLRTVTEILNWCLFYMYVHQNHRLGSGIQLPYWHSEYKLARCLDKRKWNISSWCWGRWLRVRRCYYSWLWNLRHEMHGWIWAPCTVNYFNHILSMSSPVPTTHLLYSIIDANTDPIYCCADSVLRRRRRRCRWVLDGPRWCAGRDGKHSVKNRACVWRLKRSLVWNHSLSGKHVLKLLGVTWPILQRITQ